MSSLRREIKPQMVKAILKLENNVDEAAYNI